MARPRLEARTHGQNERRRLGAEAGSEGRGETRGSRTVNGGRLRVLNHVVALAPDVFRASSDANHPVTCNKKAIDETRDLTLLTTTINLVLAPRKEMNNFCRPEPKI